MTAPSDPRVADLLRPLHGMCARGEVSRQGYELAVAIVSTLLGQVDQAKADAESWKRGVEDANRIAQRFQREAEERR